MHTTVHARGVFPAGVDGVSRAVGILENTRRQQLVQQVFCTATKTWGWQIAQMMFNIDDHRRASHLGVGFISNMVGSSVEHSLAWCSVREVTRHSNVV